MSFDWDGFSTSNKPVDPGGGGGDRIAKTASTTFAANWLAREAGNFVAREVFATLISVALSSFIGFLYLSKNCFQNFILIFHAIMTKSNA